MKAAGELLFGTAGIPRSAYPHDSIMAMARLSELGLDAMELEYVYGSFPGEEKARAIGKAAEKHSIRLTAHGPYYINLNATDQEKLEASRQRIIDTAATASLSGVESITFHAGFYLKQDPACVYKRIKQELAALVKILTDLHFTVDMRPELTGKETQFGSLDELLCLSREIEGVYPCIDWSHLYARTGVYNSASEFQSVIDMIRQSPGDGVLQRSHMHVSGIDYGAKGEKKHLGLKESGFNYRALLHVLKDNDIKGFLICESPYLEDDALELKTIYGSI